MSDQAEVLAAERAFFDALQTADLDALRRLLPPDFLLIDLRGGEISKSSLLEMLGGGVVRFEAIDVHESNVRLFGDAAVVTGHTTMRIGFAGQSAAFQSRYTHVYIRRDGAWHFVSAQGTPIA